MSDIFLDEMKNLNNVALTENGAVTYRSTMNSLMDLFAFGGAYRSRTDDDRIFLFKKAFDENEELAMKCLFYLRDAREGQGERNFFRVVIHWLAKNHTEAVRRNLAYIPYYGRYDDWYALVDTPLEDEMFTLMREQLVLDLDCKTPSLLAKWMKSINASNAHTNWLGHKTRKALRMTPRQYRKTLTTLRERIKVLEKLMSEGRWSEIEFDKIPSKAGLKYRNAFARHDIERIQAGARAYSDFMNDETTKVNAGVLNPCDVVHKATKCDSINRAVINKYWDNLKDYFNGSVFDGIAVVDTSCSMTWSFNGAILPIDVAISLGIYCAEYCSPNSPWHGHYISFSRQARLVPVEGIDFVDKVKRIYADNLCENTNIQSVFDLLLGIAVKYRVKPEDMIKNIIIISDTEFDSCTYGLNQDTVISLMEEIGTVWNAMGYELPRLIFWNVNARSNNIPMRDNGRVTFVSGYSANLFETIMSGKSGFDFILEKLGSERYAPIH